MNSYKLGMHSLGKYILLAIACWSVAELLPEIFIVVSIISIIMWYEAIKQGVTKSIKDGIIVSLFFIIPYGLLALATYKALFRDELRDAFKLLIWTVFSNPMRIINAEISHMNSVNFFVYEPFIIIGVLLVINIISNLYKKKMKRYK